MHSRGSGDYLSSRDSFTTKTSTFFGMMLDLSVSIRVGRNPRFFFIAARDRDEVVSEFSESPRM